MVAELSIGQWVERCMTAEEERGASARSVAESGRCLRRAAESFSAEGIEEVSLLTAPRLRGLMRSPLFASAMCEPATHAWTSWQRADGTSRRR